MLPRRPFGNTGIDVSILGLGTVKLGRDQGVKYPNDFAIPDDQQAAQLIAIARQQGINLIDTAPAYGTSETRLGQLLKGQREAWVICSKVGEEFEQGKSFYDFTPEHTRFSVERSLKRLRTEMIDIVLVHSDGNDEAIIRDYGTLDMLAQLKTEGKIRAFGMSTKTVEGGLLAAEKSDAVMAQHKGVLIKKALASGHATLTTGEDPVHKTFQMIFQHPGVSSAIIGTINPTHLRDNIDKAVRATARK